MKELVLYHGLCLTMLFLTYLGCKDSRKKIDGNLKLVFVMTSLIIFSDCLWNFLFYLKIENLFVLYSVNIIYFIAEILAVFEWMCFSLKTLASDFYKKNLNKILVSIPAVIVSVLTFTTPISGFIFSVKEGQYIRGTLFSIDVIIKLCYLLLPSIYAFRCAQKETHKYIKKQYTLLAIYCIPVILAGIFQTIFNIDLNCVAPVLGLAIVYKFGLANEAKDNGDLVKAIAQSYSAAYIINTDNHNIRTIVMEKEQEESTITDKRNYEKWINNGVRIQVLPEDRITVEKGFQIHNVLKHLKNKNTYSLMYKVNSEAGQEYNKATFMKAFSDEDRHELFLGIEKMETRQILLQERENFENEREEFERVKESFTSVIANIIEARDVDSGEHVLRVKSYTQYLCNQIMEDYPEYGLTPLTVRYITNGSALHDIGKIMIPDSILLKTDKLTPADRKIMETHCEKGCLILDKLPKDLDAEYTKYAKEICRWHHEKYDGNGYPDGIKGDQIPISAQIVSLADCFDALTSKRVYKDAMSKEEALAMILDGKCGIFNEKLLDCLKKICASQICLDDKK